MKGGGNARHACHVQGALPCAEVHCVALRLDDPVVPANLTEVHKELLSTAHPGPTLAVDALPANAVLAPNSYTGCHKRPMGSPTQDDWAPGYLAFRDQLQDQVPLAAGSLSFRPQEELVPTTVIHLQQVLSGEGEVGGMWAEHEDPHLQSPRGIGRELHKEHEAGLLDLQAANSSIRGEVEIKTSLVNVGEACGHKKPQSVAFGVNSTNYISILSMLEFPLFFLDHTVGIVNYPFLLKNLFSLGFHDTTLMILP